MMEDPTEMHGIFMLNHVLPQVVVAAFTQNFYFGAFAQVIINFMIFNVILPPRPLPFDFLVELNIIFVVAQLLGTALGIALALATTTPPVLEVSLPWETRGYAWRFTTWLRAALSVLLLTIPSGISYDFGVSVWTPGMFSLWGLVATGELVLLYVAVYLILRYDVGGAALPFTSRSHLQRFLALLFVVQILFINVWWPFNTLTQRATELIWVMIALVAVAFALAFVVYRYLLNARSARVQRAHNVKYYHRERARCV